MNSFLLLKIRIFSKNFLGPIVLWSDTFSTPVFELKSFFITCEFNISGIIAFYGLLLQLKNPNPVDSPIPFINLLYIYNPTLIFLVLLLCNELNNVFIFR